VGAAPLRPTFAFGTRCTGTDVYDAETELASASSVAQPSAAQEAAARRRKTSERYACDQRRNAELSAARSESERVLARRAGETQTERRAFEVEISVRDAALDRLRARLAVAEDAVQTELERGAAALAEAEAQFEAELALATELHRMEVAAAREAAAGAAAPAEAEASFLRLELEAARAEALGSVSVASDLESLWDQLSEISDELPWLRRRATLPPRRVHEDTGVGGGEPEAAAALTGGDVALVRM